jgi:lipid-binding SYLF domain-containing protein
MKVPLFQSITNRCSIGVIAAAMMASAASLAQEVEPEPTPFDRAEEVDRVVEPDRENAPTVDDDAAVDTTPAREQVIEAAEILREMQDDSDLRSLMEKAKGIFVVPDYATAALIVGAAGGEGVLFTHNDGGWGNPGLYDVGSLSAGLQAGVAAGSIAMILLSDGAVDAFRSETNFALTADAGLSIIDWSARARADIDDADEVVVWSDTEGLFAELAIGFNNVTWDAEENEEYYGQQVSASAVLDDEVADPQKELLEQALQE